jgi:hypothetical protein
MTYKRGGTMNIFKPLDFNFTFPDSRQMAADEANRILTEWIEKNGVRVYGVIDPAEERGKDFIMGTKNDKHDTHQAILINIEEIEKKPCEHEPTITSYLGTYDTIKPVCLYCGKKLRPTRWEVVE